MNRYAATATERLKDRMLLPFKNAVFALKKIINTMSIPIQPHTNRVKIIFYYNIIY